MGIVAQIKNLQTATTNIPTLASATALAVPDGGTVFYVSGSTTVATLTSKKQPGRRITLIALLGASMTITNNSDPTTEGQIDLGGSNLTFAAPDTLTLVQTNDGAWYKTSTSDL